MDIRNILIVEDDIELNKGLFKALKAEDRRLFSSTCIADARLQMEIQPMNLVILDLNLPDGNGMCLLKEIKLNYPEVKVILLTANDTDLDIVAGLEEGADDYITKPFSLSVLRARVNTQLRNSKAQKSDTKIDFEHYSFDFMKQEFKAGEQIIELSKTEQKLLHKLVFNRGNTLSRKQLMDSLWDTTEYIDENSLSVVIKRLRDKLDAGQYIKTVYGIGYKWVKECT